MTTITIGASSTTGASRSPLDALSATMAQAARHDPLAGLADATAILDTAGDFLSNAAQSVASIESGLVRRREQLDRLERSGASDEQVSHAQEQIRLWEELQRRIREAMERVQQILAGRRDEEVERAPASRALATSSITAIDVARSAVGVAEPKASTASVLRAYGAS